MKHWVALSGLQRDTRRRPAEGVIVAPECHVTQSRAGTWPNHLRLDPDSRSSLPMYLFLSHSSAARTPALSPTPDSDRSVSR